ncbi:hypothetical protein ACH5A7_21795 [Streptomyces sp. NPDC018955]|uniref:hypothetical protein n=1 Tax=Streptomyces sp. NPDC018955 TaxID=3365055 RepID=UPI00378D5301
MTSTARLSGRPAGHQPLVLGLFRIVLGLLFTGEGVAAVFSGPGALPLTGLLRPGGTTPDPPGDTAPEPASRQSRDPAGPA